MALSSREKEVHIPNTRTKKNEGAITLKLVSIQPDFQLHLEIQWISQINKSDYSKYCFKQ